MATKVSMNGEDGKCIHKNVLDDHFPSFSSEDGGGNTSMRLFMSLSFWSQIC
jgi:hypothetical protein